MTMAYWLVKSEPSVWSWDQQVAKGAKGEAWTGVRNFTARQNPRGDEERRQGLLLSFQRGQGDRRHRGVIKEAYPDPDRQDRQVRLRRHQGGQALKTPVTMAAIKADKKLADMALVKYSRLSVQPVTADEWKMVCKMGGM
jgi:predicted RNA-binding protein with PUA-like domain